MNKDCCAAHQNLTMQIASQVYGIETAENGLCFCDEGEDDYLTKRFYFVQKGKGKCLQEDFASLLGFTKVNGGSDYKYCNSSYEQFAQAIRMPVTTAAIDILKYFKSVVYNFVSLNDDAHLKNFSLINAGNEYRLSPAYDLINTSLHLAQPRIFALDKGLFKEGVEFSDTHTVGRKEFEEFGSRIGLPTKVIQRELNKFAEKNPLTEMLISCSFLSDTLKKRYQMSTDYRRMLLRE